MRMRTTHRHAMLLIEDHDDTRDAFAMLAAELEGVDVVAVATGAEGLARLRRQPARWCLVVLDWWLADMSGEAFRREQLADPRMADVSLAVVTGDARVRGAARKLGIANFFLKPIDPDALFGLLTHHPAAARRSFLRRGRVAR
jgi:two-component system chemotaxis response regulator CheY